MTTEHNAFGLLALSDTDRKIAQLRAQKNEIEERRKADALKLQQEKERLRRAEAKQGARASVQAADEAKIHEEEHKIVERRRQISTIGGVKAAKLAEREVDVAAKTVRQMEEKLLVAMEEVEAADRELSGARESVAHLEDLAASAEPVDRERLSVIESSLASLVQEREKLLSGVEASLLRLYDRIRNRYPNDAAVRADRGACGGCFRSLPPHVFNQVLESREIIQCPDCGRILALSGETSDAGASA